MTVSYTFLKSILDTITEHIVVINSAGDILFVNHAWTTFGKHNNCLIDDDWSTINYLQECDKAAKNGDIYGLSAASGIRDVIHGSRKIFYFEYPCHSPEEERWFMMRVTSFSHHDTNCFVISHQNITERKLAEDKLLHASRTDSLTDIPNRKYFNEFLSREWRRCQRFKQPISLALIDLDHFKALNDTYGHQVGDQCLVTIGGVLKQYAKRTSDICARYGGEEFVIVYSETTHQQATLLINSLLQSIRKLQIPNKNATTTSTLTASAGVSTMTPSLATSESDLITCADKLLYQAKHNGRDQVMSSSDQPL